MKVETKVGELPPNEWEALSEGASVFATSRWLRAIEGRAAGPPHYFFLTDGGEPSVGLFGMLCQTAATDDAFNLFEIVAGIPRTMPLTEEATAARADLHKSIPPAEAWFPNMILSLPSAECALVGSAAGSREAVGTLVDGIIEWARGQSLAAISFLYVRRPQAVLEAALSERHFIRSALTHTCELHLPGSEFEDYLGMFSKHRRQSIRREIRVVEGAGVEIRRRGLGECLDQLVELRLALKRKYGRSPNEDKERRTFSGLMDNFSEDELNLFTAEADGRVLAFGLDLIWNGVWHGLLSGTDYDDPKSNFVSFHLDFYSPIRRAYEIGVREFQMGTASWEAKHHRGCALVPMDAWTLPVDPKLAPAVSESASRTRLRWEKVATG